MKILVLGVACAIGTVTVWDLAKNPDVSKVIAGDFLLKGLTSLRV